MDLAVVKGATAEAHRHGLVVFAHPGSAEGVARAVEGGVDVLAHTAPDVGPVDRRAAAPHAGAAHGARADAEPVAGGDGPGRGVARSSVTGSSATGAEQLRAFAASGGEVLFGTDVGYIPEKDADEEVGRMAGAGHGLARHAGLA